MQKIYKLIYPELPLSEFCENEKRYKWLKTYLCETNEWNFQCGIQYIFLLISLCVIQYVQYVFMYSMTWTNIEYKN